MSADWNTLRRESGTSGGAGAYADQHIGYLNKIGEAYHKNGTRFFAQLCLPGFGFYDSNSSDINKLTKKGTNQNQRRVYTGSRDLQKGWP